MQGHFLLLNPDHVLITTNMQFRYLILWILVNNYRNRPGWFMLPRSTLILLVWTLKYQSKIIINAKNAYNFFIELNLWFFPTFLLPGISHLKHWQFLVFHSTSLVCQPMLVKLVLISILDYTKEIHHCNFENNCNI